MTTLLADRDADSHTPPDFKGSALPRMERGEFLGLPGLQIPRNSVCLSIIYQSFPMFPVGNTDKISPWCQQEANGSDSYTKAQGFGGQRLLPLHTHGKCGSHSFWFLSYPALSVSKGRVWENWEMLLPPQLTLHWEVRAQELSRVRFLMVFSAAPC